MLARRAFDFHPVEIHILVVERVGVEISQPRVRMIHNSSSLRTARARRKSKSVAVSRSGGVSA
jgi:hypothetical protein